MASHFAYAAHHWKTLAQLNHFDDLVSAFFWSIRYDAATVALVNLPLLVLNLLLWKVTSKTAVQSLQKFLFIFLNALFVLPGVIDIEYVNFSGKRITFDSLSIAGDAARQGVHLLADYWFVPLFTGLSAVVLFLAVNRFAVRGQTANPRISKGQLFGHLLLLLGVAFTARGGSQVKPLTITHAYSQKSSELALYSLNSSFTLLKSYKSNSLGELPFEIPLEEAVMGVDESLGKPAERISSPDQRSSSEAPQGDPEARIAQRPNFVILILESFGLEYSGIGNSYPGYMPFVDSLAERGVFYSRHFANGRRSIDALPSILAGVPTLMDDAFITSNFQSNRMIGIGEVLGHQGYSSAFFHGGENGTMFFDVMSRRFGFQNYFGLNEYPQKNRDYDGAWGIPDEPFLQFMSAKISEMKPPFITAAFTLSSHDPFRVPDQYRGVFPKGNLPIHETIGYSDMALQKFFETASKEPWYPNTIFILTADHTSKSDVEKYSGGVGHFRVPLVLYAPGMQLKLAKSDQIAQQVDIFPTILELAIGREALETTSHARFGASLAGAKGDRVAQFHGDGSQWLVQGDLALRWQMATNSWNVFRWNDDPTALRPVDVPPEKLAELTQKLKARLVYFHKGMLQNQLNWPKEGGKAPDGDGSE